MNYFEGYWKTFVFEEQKTVIAQKTKRAKVYLFVNDTALELPYDRLIDSYDELIRVVKHIDSKKKWGLINALGQEIIPPIYDYIALPINSNYFKVFNGNFKWNLHNEEYADLYYDNIHPNSWNGDEFRGVLGKGLWGIVDRNNQEIIPTIYNWIEFYSDTIFVYNKNGSRIIKWYSGDEKEIVWSILDGVWGAIFLDGRSLKEISNIHEYIEFYNKLDQTGTFDQKYSKQIIEKYFSSAEKKE